MSDALNFPANPGAQTPVNTYSPTSTPDATTNGQTFRWNGVTWEGTAFSQSSYWDRNGTVLSPLNLGDEVHVKDGANVSQIELKSTGDALFKGDITATDLSLIHI